MATLFFVIKIFGFTLGVPLGSYATATDCLKVVDASPIPLVCVADTSVVS